MVNKNGKQSRQRNLAAKPRKTKRAKGKASRSRENGETEMVCSQLDPFCPHATGAKILDEDSTRSFTYRSVGAITPTADANGNWSATFSPDLATFMTVNTVDANGKVTAVTPQANPDLTELMAVGSRYRVVSWGIRLTDISAAVVSAGTIQMRTSNSPPVVGSDLNSSAVGRQWFPGKGAKISFISKRTGSAYRTYQPLSTTDTDYELPTDLVTVYLSGVAADSDGQAFTGKWDEPDGTGQNGLIEGKMVGSSSGATLMVEYIYNVEILPSEGSVMAQTATTAGPANSRVSNATANVSAAQPSFYQGAVSMISSGIRKAASFALGFAGNVGRQMLTDYFRPPPSWGPPMIVD